MCTGNSLNKKVKIFFTENGSLQTDIFFKAKFFLDKEIKIYFSAIKNIISLQLNVYISYSKKIKNKISGKV